MKIKSSIFDDNGVNVNGRICVFHYTKEFVEQKLGSAYDEPEFITGTNNIKCLGIFEEDKQQILSLNAVYNPHVDINDIEIKKVKIVDIDKLINEYMES